MPPLQTTPPSRNALRRILMAQRYALPAARRMAASQAACTALAVKLQAFRQGAAQYTVALYVPHALELDILQLASQFEGGGPSWALPVMQGADLPLRFAAWQWGEPLVTGAYGIGVPAQLDWVGVDCVIAPCVGFMPAAQGGAYRLGYGGGYYDRTLAALQLSAQASPKARRLRTLGVAYASARCVFPAQAHDVPLDAVVHV